MLTCKKSDDTQKDKNDQPDSLYYKTISRSYSSSTLGNIQRPLVILLPSNYDTITSPLPVLYLFHGSGENEFAWITDGKIDKKLSVAYKAGTIVPMIVVLPYLPDCEPEGFNCFGVGPEGDGFVKEMVTDIIPWVESNYKVATDRQNRAIAGLSNGGHQTLNMGIFFPEKFDYVYPLSAGFFGNALTEINTHAYDEAFNNPEINNIKKFTLFIGKQDEIAMQRYTATLQLLNQYGIHYGTWEADGGHDYIFWQKCMDIILPELFREDTR